MSVGKGRGGSMCDFCKNNPVTTNLADFGYRELAMAKDLLNAMFESGLPDGFYDEGVTIAFNRNSGYVFLTNEDYDVCMNVDGKLKMWYWLIYHGNEGFVEDLITDYDNGNVMREDWEQLADICEAEGYTDKAKEIRERSVAA